MRQAHRSLEAMSALLAAAALWPTALVAGILVAKAINITRLGNFRAAVLYIIFVGVLLVAGVGIWAVLNGFFSSTRRFVSITSLLLFALFLHVVSQMFAKLAAHARAHDNGDILTSLGMAYSLALAFFFYWHGLRLWFLTPDERKALVRPRSWKLQTYWGITTPVASVLRIVAKMLQGLSAYILCVAFGAMLFNFVTVLRIGGYSLPHGARLDMSAPAGSATVAVQIGIFFGSTLTTGFLLTQAAMGLKRVARWFSRYSFDQTVRRDKRPHFLFLRCFRDDQVTLPSLPVLLRYWLAEPEPRRLDHVLIERFGVAGPVIAMGKPGEQSLPFGAARLYVSGSDSEWKLRVAELALSARAIVVVVDESDGILWEIGCMLEERFVAKTLFIASPSSVNRGLESHSLLGPLMSDHLPGSKGFHVMAAFRNGIKWERFCVNTATADDYIVCCQAFFANVLRDLSITQERKRKNTGTSP